jgi:hypothetical protein
MSARFCMITEGVLLELAEVRVVSVSLVLRHISTEIRPFGKSVVPSHGY